MLVPSGRWVISVGDFATGSKLASGRPVEQRRRLRSDRSSARTTTPSSPCSQAPRRPGRVSYSPLRSGPLRGRRRGVMRTFAFDGADVPSPGRRPSARAISFVPPGPLAHVRRERGGLMQTDDLRTMVEALDRAMSRCLADGSTPAGAPTLLASWARLVDHLALEPPPVFRRCPSCGRSTAREATLCDGCWRTLEPLLPLASA